MISAHNNVSPPAAESDLSPGSSSSSSSSSASPLRSELVTAAKQFLANPRVRQTPLEEQKTFLRGKGLTEAEIQAALTVREAPNECSPSSVLLPSPASSSGSRVSDLARSALVFGTAGYMVYRFVRSWLLPQLLNVPDPAEERMQRLEEQVARLSESSRCIAESVAQTLAAVTEQNEQISRTMMMNHGRENDTERLHAEIGIVKSLLLSQHQFPPVPEPARSKQHRHNHLQNGQSGNGRGKGTVPAWQMEQREGEEEEGESQDGRADTVDLATNGSSV